MGLAGVDAQAAGGDGTGENAASATQGKAETKTTV